MGFLNSLRGVVENSVSSTLDNLQDEVEYRVSYIVKKVERRMVRTMISWGMIILGIAFLSLTVAFFLSEYLLLSRTLSFLVISILFFIIGVVMKAIR
jgi:VIT1/CCC1 family predicted Fe2+/Mn2+ transporter